MMGIGIRQLSHFATMWKIVNKIAQWSTTKMTTVDYVVIV